MCVTRCVQSGAFLRVTLFTRKHLRGDTPLRIEDDQGFSRQGFRRGVTQHLEPMLTRFQTIPIQIFHSKTRQYGRMATRHVLNHRLLLHRDVTHEGLRRAQFDAV